MNTSDIIALIESDNWMISVLREAEKLNLNDWMIGAGFLRNKVWDHLHGIKRKVADTNDVDLVYFDLNNINETSDRKLSEKMGNTLGLRWEIKNQAYMHTRHGHNQYKNTEEGISHWVETPTCVAVTLKSGKPEIIAPHGIEDLVNLIVRPTPGREDLKLFYERVEKKKWLKKWPKLKVVPN